MSAASFPEIAPLPAVMGMKDVCDLIGITSETARRLINDGALPGHRVPGGRQWVFRTEEVLAAISAWRVDGGGAVVAAVEEHDPPHSVASEDDTSCSQLDEITCPAPSRSAEESDEDWIHRCGEALVTALAAVKVSASYVGDGIVAIGDERREIVIETRQVQVLDDFGDDAVEEVTSVSIRRCGGQ